MRLDMGPDGSIQTKDGFVFLRCSLLVASALFVGLATLTLVSDPDRRRTALGQLAGALGCAAFAVLLEDSEFRFDAGKRELRWSKRRLFGRQSGVVPFADVEDVVLEVRSTRSDSGLGVTEDCRVLLVTRAGEMAIGSSNLDLAGARDRIARPLLALLGKGDRVEERRLTDRIQSAGKR